MKTALLGFTGAGKSSALRTLGAGSTDVDEVIGRRSGRSVEEISAQDGGAALRALEEQVTLELLADPEVHTVALGGGALDSAGIRGALEQARVVLLDVEPRRPRYEALADVILPAGRAQDLSRVLDSIDGLGPKQARVLWAATASADYPVYIGEGLVSRDHFWPATVGGRRVVISDYNAARHYADAFEPALASVRIMPGEQSKTLAHAEIVWTEMVRHGVTRTDVAVALGGGVVGDLAGFCASAFQRGMRVVQVPTTLVAQVDSAYGGKTGVDLTEAKNYVGAFHQPVAVIADTGTLATLPAEELAAGYAEVVKTGLLAGGELWELISGGAAATDPRVIAGCALTKLRIVAEDEHDTGPRQLLNLGHTVGHAIETATGYARYRHGEAVALGLLAALRLSGADDLRTEVAELLAGAGLALTLDRSVEVDQVIFATARDKKRVGEGPVPFVLCPAPGQAQFGQFVPPSELRAAVKELLA